MDAMLCHATSYEVCRTHGQGSTLGRDKLSIIAQDCAHGALARTGGRQRNGALEHRQPASSQQLWGPLKTAASAWGESRVPA